MAKEIKETQAQWDDVPAKVVGHRKALRGDLIKTAGLFDLVLKLRGNKRFVPRGVYRFKTFEEADQWLMRMMTRR